MIHSVRKILLSVLLLFPVIAYSQGLPSNVNGAIPISIFTDSYPSQIPLSFHLPKMFDMKVDNITINSLYNTTPSINNNIFDNGTWKIRYIPNNQDLDNNNLIAKYTDAWYTKWEAEGTPSGKGKATLFVNGEVGTIDSKGYVSTSPLKKGVLIYGPGYIEQYNHKIEEEDPRPIYTDNFHIRVNSSLTKEQIDMLGNTPLFKLSITRRPLIKTDKGCTLGSRDTIGSPRIVTAAEVKNLLGIWTDFQMTHDYRDTNIYRPAVSQREFPTSPIDSFYTVYNESSNQLYANTLSELFIEYVVEWEGVSGFSLDVDYIETYDDRGNDLIKKHLLDNDIKDFVDRFKETDGSYSNIAAWYAVDEPGTIDNFEPIRYIDSLLNAHTGGQQRLFLTFCSQWAGYLSEYITDVPEDMQPWQGVWTTQEIVERTGIKEAFLNWYPIKDNTSNNWADIFRMTNCGLAKLNKVSNDFGFSVQSSSHSGNNPLDLPTPDQMLYHMNMGLLYGAKQIGFWNYWGLVDAQNNCELTELGLELKNTISPRLRGDFGKTLKAVTQKFQIPENISPYSYLSDNMKINDKNYPYISVQKYVPILSEIQASVASPSNVQNEGEGTIDYGRFSKDGENYTNYLMLVNRYYSQWVSYKIGFPFINSEAYPSFKNWNVTELAQYISNGVNRGISYWAGPNQNVFDFPYLGKGDAFLFRVGPSVENGGEIRENETVSGSFTLQRPLTINSGTLSNTTLTIGTNSSYTLNDVLTVSQGCSLKVESGAHVYAHANIEVASGGSLILSPGAVVEFLDGAVLNVNGSFTSNGITSGGTINHVLFDFTSPYNSQGLNDNGIKINAGATLNMAYTKVMNANIGITTNSPQVTVTNSEIYNCNTGIYFNNLNNQSGGTVKPIIDNNIIRNNNYIGLSFNQSSVAYVTNCQIYENGEYGVTCYNSSPAFGYANHKGSDYIRNNGYAGIYAYSNSNIFLGSTQYANYGGYSAIVDNNGYNLYADLNCTIKAQRNYWHKLQSAVNIAAVNGSSVDASYPLSTNPFGTLIPPQSIAGGNNPSVQQNIDSEIEPKTLQDLVSKADDYYYSDNFDKAKLISVKVMENYPDSAASLYALDVFTRASLMSKSGDSLKLFLKKLATKDKKNGLSAEAEIRLAYDSVSVLNKFDRIIRKYGNEKISEDVIYQKIIYSMMDLHNIEKAKEIYLSSGESFANSHLGKLSRIFLFGSSPSYGLNKSHEDNLLSDIPNSYNLMGNYPNPFNPTTTIKYSLPYNSDVDIIIYNIMGQKVKDFTLQSQPKGYQQVIWNGCDNFNNPVSSGIYIYRFRAKSIETSDKEFIKTAKMMMIK